jgi:hypothetical protein
MLFKKMATKDKNKGFHLFKKVGAGSYPCVNKSLSNLQGERWKPIPDYEDSYMVSTCGRVKSIERFVYYKNGSFRSKEEMIMSQTILSTPNSHLRDFTTGLCVNLRKEGKVRGFSVRRLVYYCFIEPFDLFNYKFCIIPKDGNGLNCHYKNLRKVSVAQKVQLIYERERIINPFTYLDHHAFVFKSIAKISKMVSQYNIAGEKIKLYPSIMEASRNTNIKHANISGVANGRKLKAGGYVWKFGDGPQKIDLSGIWEAEKKRQVKRNQKPVTQYNLRGERIAVYSSIVEAGRSVGVPPACICVCLVGKCSNIKGFIWRYGKGTKRIDTAHIITLKKRIAQYALDGTLLAVYNSIREAAKKLGLTEGAIGQAVRGVRKRSGGYRWEQVKWSFNEAETPKKGEKIVLSNCSLNGL